MSMIGNFVAFGDDQLQKLIADPDSVLSVLFPEVDDPPIGLHLDIDKSWHGIHFLLTGSAWEGNPPISLAILGGTEIGEDGGYGPARYLIPEEVKALSSALQEVSPEDLITRQTPEAMLAAELYSCDGSPDDLEYIQSYYDSLRQFYFEAACRGDAVLLALT